MAPGSIPGDRRSVAIRAAFAVGLCAVLCGSSTPLQAARAPRASKPRPALTWRPLDPEPGNPSAGSDGWYRFGGGVGGYLRLETMDPRPMSGRPLELRVIFRCGPPRQTGAAANVRVRLGLEQGDDVRWTPVRSGEGNSTTFDTLSVRVWTQRNGGVGVPLRQDRVPPTGEKALVEPDAWYRVDFGGLPPDGRVVRSGPRREDVILD